MGFIVLFAGVLLYSFIVGFIRWIERVFVKISYWSFADWLVCFFIVGLMITLYILTARHSKKRYFSANPFRPFKLNKGRSIYEITAGLTPRDFEIFVADLYRHSGYHTEVTPQSNDNGKDIILTKNKEVTYVECKLYKDGNNIGRPPLQKLHGAMAKDKIERGIFVTTSNFSKTAVEYARGTGIELVDGDDLIRLIRDVRPELLREDYVAETEPIV
jgi:restriction system protein